LVARLLLDLQVNVPDLQQNNRNQVILESAVQNPAFQRPGLWSENNRSQFRVHFGRMWIFDQCWNWYQPVRYFISRQCECARW